MQRNTKAPTFKNSKATAQWFKNVGKSLGYVTGSTFTGLVPGITASAKDARDLAKEYADPVKTMFSKNTTMKQRVDSLLKSENSYVDLASEAFKNLKTDLKSGNLYNKERADKVMGEAFDMGGMDFDVDFDFDDMGDDSFSEDGEPRDTTVVVPKVNISTNINSDNPMVKGIQRQTEVQLNVAKAQLASDKALAKIEFDFLQGLNGNLVQGMSSMNENLSNMINFNNSTVAKGITAQNEYYQSSLKLMEDMLTELKKISTPKISTPEMSKFRDVNDIFMYGSEFSFSAYADQIKKNIKNRSESSMFGSVLGMLTSDEGILKSFAANPLGLVTEALVGMAIPGKMKTEISRFDNALMAFLPALTKKMSSWANDLSGGDGIFGSLKNLFGEILGVKVQRKTTVDLGNYERGPVPFDGVTRRSIVEVIPGYLSKILAVLSNQPALVYDYKAGKFKTFNKMKADFESDTRRSVLSEFDYESRDKIDKMISSSGYGADTKKKIEDALIKGTELDEIIQYTKLAKGDKDTFNKLFNDKSSRNGLAGNNVLSADEMKLVAKIFSSFGKTEAMKFFGIDMMNASQKSSSAYRRMEVEDRETAGTLFNGLYDDHTIKANTASISDEQKRINELKKLISQNNITAAYQIPEEYSDLAKDRDIIGLMERNRKSGKSSDEGKFKIFKGDNPVSKFINSVMEKPLEFLNKQANKFETVLHDIIFGSSDGSGNQKFTSVKDKFVGMFDSLKAKAKGFFDSIMDKLFDEENGFFSKIQNSEWYKNITNKGKELARKAGRYLFGEKNADTGIREGGLFSGAYNSAKSGLSSAWSSAKESFASGKQSLAEMYGAKDFKSLVSSGLNYIAGGFKSLKDSLFGSDNSDESNEQRSNDALKFIKDNAPDALGKGILGAGAGLFASATTTGLLSGLMIGPIGGAAIGIAGSLLSKSETFKNFMFGEMDETTNERIGGFISKSTQDFFKNNKKALVGGGLIGGGAGLLGMGILPGFILGGPIAGAVTGIAGAMMIKSESFQRFLFGDDDHDGLIDRAKSAFGEKFPTKLKESMPSGIAGSIAGAGLLGLVGLNPIIGAFGGMALGILTKSDAWSRFMFGDPDDDSKKGVAGRFTEFVGTKIAQPLMIYTKSLGNSILNWFDEDIKGPIMDTFDYAVAGFKALARNMSEKEGPIKWINEKLFTPIRDKFSDVADNLFDFSKKLLKGAIGTVGKIVGRIVSTPLNLVRTATVSVVKGFFHSSVMKEARAPFVEMIEKATEGIRDTLGKINDGIKKITSSIVKGVFNLLGLPFKGIAKIPKGIGWIGNKLSGGKLGEWADNKRQSNIQSVIERMNDIRSGNRTGFQKFRDFGDSFNPFSKLRRYGKYAVTDEDGDSILGGLINRQNKRAEEREEARKKRQEELDKLKNKFGNKDTNKALKRSIAGYKTFTPAEKAMVSVENAISEDTSTIVDLLKSIVSKFTGKSKNIDTTSSESSNDNKSTVDKKTAKEKSMKKPKVGSDSDKSSEKRQSLFDKIKGKISDKTKASADEEKQSLFSKIKGKLSKKSKTTSNTPTVGDDSLNIKKQSLFSKIKGKVPDGVAKKAGGLASTASSVAAGVKSGFSSLLGKAAGSLGPLIGGLGKLVIPLAAKAGLIAIGAIALFALFKNPDKFFGFIGGAVKTAFHFVFETVIPKVVQAVTNFAEKLPGIINTGVEFLTDTVIPKVSELLKKFVGALPDMLSNGYKMLGNFFKDSVPKMLNNLAENIPALEPVVKVLNVVSKGIGTLYTILSKTIKPILKSVGDVIGFIWDGLEPIVDPLLNAVEGILDFFGGDAVGNSNVEKNGPRNLHANEGVLTAGANHLFGGGASTADVLNEYARRGLQYKENIPGRNTEEKLVNVLSGTLGGAPVNTNTSVTPVPTDAALMSALGTGNKDLSNAMFNTSKETLDKLTKYTQKINKESLSASSSEYWEIDKEGEELGGLGKVLFRTTRIGALPGKMINEALESVDTQLDADGKNIETKTTGLVGTVTGWFSNIGSTVTNALTDMGITEGVSSDKSLWSNAKTVAGNVLSGVGNFFSGLTDTSSLTDNATNKAVGGGEIEIGNSTSDYYKFPSDTISTSDVNFRRTLSGGVSSPHKGLDMKVRDRTNRFVRSTTNGIVVYTGSHPVYGNMVQVRDDNGMYHMYGHLSTIMVSNGSSVSVGTVLGIEGSTGQSTGSHVHYEVGTGSIYGDHLIGRVHPAEYVKGYSNGSSMITATPIDKYHTGSYWSGYGGNKSRGFGIGGRGRSGSSDDTNESVVVAQYGTGGALEAGPTGNHASVAILAHKEGNGRGSDADLADVAQGNNTTEQNTQENKSFKLTDIYAPFSQFATALAGSVSSLFGMGDGNENTSTGTIDAAMGTVGSSVMAMAGADGTKLGDYTKQFESGTRGSSTISSGNGDAGGVSYGTYQFASNGGGLKAFWDKYYASQYPNVTPGASQSFKDAWLDAVNADPTGFANNEHQYIFDNYYKVFTSKSSNTSKINPDRHSRAAQEIAWSTAIQYGPNDPVWANAINHYGLNSNTSPADLINAVQDFKVASVGTSNFNGSSADVQASVRNRFNNGERQALLSISDNTPIAVGGGELGSVDRFKIKNVGGGERGVIVSGNAQVIQLLKTIVQVLTGIETNTKTTSDNISKLPSKSSETTNQKKETKSTSSRNASMDIAEQRRKEKYKSDYKIASAIAKGV